LLSFLLLFSIYCAISIGQSWDEGFHYNQGKITLEYLFSLGRVDTDLSFREYYSPIYWSLQYFIAEIFPSKYTIEILHLTNLTFSLCIIFGIGKIGKELFNQTVGKIIFLILFFYPAFFGQMSFNPKDTILAFSHVWITYFAIRYLKEQHINKKRNKYLLRLSLLAALSTGIQLVFLGSMIPLLLFLILEISIFKKIININFSIKKFLYDLIKCFILFYLVLVLFWIDAHPNIFILPLKFITETFFTNFWTGWPYNLLNGNYLSANEVPGSYFFIYIFYKSPEYFLICYLFFILSYFKLKDFYKKEFSFFNYKLLFLVFILIYPGLVLFIIPYPIYDGLRLFYWTLPYLAVIPSLLIYYLIKNINYLRSKISILIISSASLIFLYNFIMITPYQYTYLNVFSGPAKNRFNKFENDYWGGSIKELVKKTKFENNHIIKLSTCGVNPKISKKYFRKRGLNLVQFVRPEESKYMLMTNRTTFDNKTGKISNCFNTYKGKNIYEVKRNGLILSSIREIN